MQRPEMMKPQEMQIPEMRRPEEIKRAEMTEDRNETHRREKMQRAEMMHDETQTRDNKTKGNENARRRQGRYLPSRSGRERCSSRTVLLERGLKRNLQQQKHN
jgi:hypothetical protein